MKKKKIKNPLIKRIPRELLGDWKKYLVVALFLILTIGFVSGMYVANESMLYSAAEGVTKVTTRILSRSVPQKKLMETFQCRLLGVTTVYPGMNID